MENNKKSFKDIVNHLKNSGFVFSSSQIYGGLANSFDYGPLAVLMMENIKNEWKKTFVFKEKNNFLVDTKILLNPLVWKASGHIGNFSDPLIENKINHLRYRADHIYEKITNLSAAKLTKEELYNFIVNNVKEYDNSPCNWTNIMNFNLMFETSQGVIEENKNKIYLRPETAQGIFINFNNLVRSMRLKLPFGIGQIGKSFRNEVTPGNFIFRTREFEQMELEFFTYPNSAQNDFNYYVNKSFNFLKSLGIKETSLKLKEHQKEELSHYSLATTDIEFVFPFGQGELMGIANRGDYDLKAHNKLANEELKYFDQENNQFIIPYVIEPSIGLDRLLLALICDAYEEEMINDEKRIVLKLNKNISPYKVCILPLVKKFTKNALEIYNMLINENISVSFEESGSIGKRYRRQDSIGTYYCITFDYDSINDNKVTIRDRDTLKQERIEINKIIDFINKN